jgi:hypothetical protein
MSNFRLASNRNQISAIDFIQLGSTANKLAAYTKSKKVKRLEASLPEKTIFRFFRFFWVGFRFISVFEKPTSVSVSVFQKTAVSVRFSVNRLKTRPHPPPGYFRLPDGQAPRPPLLYSLISPPISPCLII